MALVLIVDDEPSVCWAFERLVRSLGHRGESAPSAEKALERLEVERPDLVLLDLRLPGMSGLEALQCFRDHDRNIPVVLITAHGSFDAAVEAMKSGAFDYLTKPVDLAQAEHVIARALERRQLSQEVEKLRAAVRERSSVQTLVGQSACMQEVFKKIGTVCSSDATVLVTGESGTGKELVARAIHSRSGRATGPFEPVHCASLPESLLESELFGHERGAFTGALAQKAGRLARAHGGTVFLDEIGEIPPGAQVKLLRFLEDKTIQRLGGGDPIRLDVRLIAATNADLGAKVAARQYREDLYYRLNVLTIRLPALRERREDLPLLVAHFLEQEGASGITVSQEAMDLLCRYGWPGNVRELRNAIVHALVVCRGRTILPEHLPLALLPAARASRELVRKLLDEMLTASSGATQDLFSRALEMWEKPFLEAVLERCRGNLSEASRLLGINRATLRKRLQKYDIRPSEDGKTP